MRVRDIGRAVEGPERSKLAAWSNNKRAIVLTVMKQPSANVIETADRIKAVLPQLQAAMPPAVKVSGMHRGQTDAGSPAVVAKPM